MNKMWRRQTVEEVLGTKPHDKRVRRDIKKLCESLQKIMDKKNEGVK